MAAKGSKTAKRKVGKQIPVQDLSALKDSIVSEMGDAKDKVTKPFANVVLPEERRGGRGGARFGAWVLPVVFVLALVGVWVWLVVSSGSNTASRIALSNVVQAVETRDVSMFTRHVDVAKVADSVASQMFVAPEVGEELPAAVQAQLANMQARFDAVVKPSLVADLEAEILSYVETGAMSGDGTGPTMLARLLSDLTGDGAVDVKISSVQEQGMDAVATVLITRADLMVDDKATVVPVQVLMAQQDNAWQVVGLPSLNAALNQLALAEAEVNAAAQGEISRKLNALFEVEKLSKASVSDDAMLVAMSVVNKGSKEVAGFTGIVTFTDAGGRVMKEIALQDSDAIAAGGRLVKTWTVPVDTAVSAEKHLLVLPMSAIAAKFTPVRVAFADGTVLSGE